MSRGLPSKSHGVGHWSVILGVVGIVVAILAWFFPFDEIGPPPFNRQQENQVSPEIATPELSLTASGVSLPYSTPDLTGAPPSIQTDAPLEPSTIPMPINTSTPPAERAVPTPTTPTQITNPLESSATQRCLEFHGSPIARDRITLTEVSVWRQIGWTDKDETGRVIYCEIHQVPGFIGFTEGSKIPASAIITADLGFHWDSVYAGALERLVHEGGGWGVFMTLKEIEVQHASDLSSRVGGQYWLVSH